MFSSIGLTQTAMNALLGVKDTGLLKDLCNNRNSRVDRVGNDTDESVRAVLSNALGKVADDAGVDVEEVIARHTRLYPAKQCKQSAHVYFRQIDIKGEEAGD